MGLNVFAGMEEKNYYYYFFCLPAQIKHLFRTTNNQEQNLMHSNSNSYLMHKYYIWPNHEVEIVPHLHYNFRMERALQRHNPDIMLPYWDSALDDHLGDLANSSIMWSPEFMGNSQGRVVTGPFANWPTLRPTYGRWEKLESFRLCFFFFEWSKSHYK